MPKQPRKKLFYAISVLINPAIVYRNLSSPLVGDLSLFSEGFRTSRNDKNQVFDCRLNRRHSRENGNSVCSEASGHPPERV